MRRMTSEEVSANERLPSDLPKLPTTRSVMMDGTRGQPTKLTVETVDTLLEAIEAGMTYKDACTCAGITYEGAMRAWMRKAKAAIEAGEVDEYVSFFYLVEQAKVRGKKEAIDAWRAQFTEDWRAPAQFLERRYPEEFGRRDKLDVSGQIEHGVVMLPPLQPVDDREIIEGEVIDEDAP